ncbi:hypothetical protein G6F68_017158 [Rhizopus microsporus]|nr:hypothetical protein G6F68_017158 [Rhizopus microsporus]
MATVIDALVVTLGMNAKGFKQGAAEVDSSLTHTREESAKTAREMEARGKQAALFFSKVRNEALALLAVFTAGMGIKSFVSSTIQIWPNGSWPPRTPVDRSKASPSN